MQIPNGAAGYFLLGQICKMTRREEKAIEYFSTALQLDVLMWSAYQELCSLGEGHVSSVAPGILVYPMNCPHTWLSACQELRSVGDALCFLCCTCTFQGPNELPHPAEAYAARHGPNVSLS